MNPFDYNNSPTPEMIDQMTGVREMCEALTEFILTIPNGRERSLAITNIEQAAMWANKAITHSTQGQAPKP